MMLPKIGIISFVPPAAPKNFTTPVDYIRCTLDAGGMPIGIPVSDDISRCEAYVEMIDGLLVPGGEDVSPRLYGEDPIPQVTSSIIEKDLFEYELIRLTAKAGKPIFGICRGHQIINTALGGTLMTLAQRNLFRFIHIAIAFVLLFFNLKKSAFGVDVDFPARKSCGKACVLTLVADCK